MSRNSQLIEQRNRAIAASYFELEPVLRNYSDVVKALSQAFFLSEYRIQSIIRQMVKDNTFKPSGDAKKHVRKRVTSRPIRLSLQLSLW